MHDYDLILAHHYHCTTQRGEVGSVPLQKVFQFIHSSLSLLCRRQMYLQKNQSLKLQMFDHSVWVGQALNVSLKIGMLSDTVPLDKD